MAMTWEEAMDKRSKRANVRKAAKVKSLGPRPEKRENSPEVLLVRKYYTGSEIAYELISSKTMKPVSRGYESEEAARDAIPLISLK